MIDHPVVAVRELPDRRNNYTLRFAPTQGTNAHPTKFGNLIINNGTVSVIMPSYKTDFNLTVQTRPTPVGNRLFTGGEIVAEAHGTYAAAPVTGRFIGGALLSLRDPSLPYPIDLQVQNGTTLAHLAGTLDDPEHLSGAHLRLSFSGQNMADLYQLTGVPIPATPPFSLTGNLDYSKSAFRFEDFYGHMGSSDIEGTATEALTSPRPMVTAEITSHRVDLTDLAGLLGGTPGKPSTPGQTAATRAKVEAANARPNLLPHKTFDLPMLNAMNVDLHYRGEQSSIAMCRSTISSCIWWSRMAGSPSIL